MNARNLARQTALCGLLLALMLVLGYVESLLPAVVAVPGIKLGLSNGVLIFAVYMLDLPTAFTLMLLKVTLSSLAFAGFGAFPYALAGGVLSLTTMALLSRVKGIHPITVSMVGGAAHNIGQVAMAMFMLNTPHLIYYMAILTIIGLVTGALTGFCASLVMKHLKTGR